MGVPQDAAIFTDEENEAPRRILTQGPGSFHKLMDILGRWEMKF